MWYITRIDIATLDILGIIWTPARSVHTSCFRTCLGVDADAVCGPGSGSKIVGVGTVAVQGCEGGSRKEEERKVELHFDCEDLMVRFMVGGGLKGALRTKLPATRSFIYFVCWGNRISLRLKAETTPYVVTQLCSATNQNK